MKFNNFLIFAIIVFSIIVGCKTVHKTEIKNNSISTNSKFETSSSGIVSLHYLKDGCGAVVKLRNNEENLTLIPTPALDSVFAKEGLVIFFNYRLLRMKNPDGCLVGLPAELTEISTQ